jgi:hypothetical protein
MRVCAVSSALSMLFVFNAFLFFCSHKRRTCTSSHALRSSMSRFVLMSCISTLSFVLGATAQVMLSFVLSAFGVLLSVGHFWTMGTVASPLRVLLSTNSSHYEILPFCSDFLFLLLSFFWFLYGFLCMMMACDCHLHRGRLQVEAARASVGFPAIRTHCRTHCATHHWAVVATMHLPRHRRFLVSLEFVFFTFGCFEENCK